MSAKILRFPSRAVVRERFPRLAHLDRQRREAALAVEAAADLFGPGPLRDRLLGVADAVSPDYEDAEIEDRERNIETKSKSDYRAGVALVRGAK